MSKQPQRFARERMGQRVEAFRMFVQQQGWDPGAQPRGEKGFLTFLVTDGQTSVSVMFTPQGGIHLWGKSGPLKTGLVEWISQEQPGYIDHSAAWLSLRARSTTHNASSRYDMLIAQIQRTAHGLILTDVDGVQVGLPTRDVLELVDWVNERRGEFELMARRAKAPE